MSYDCLVSAGNPTCFILTRQSSIRQPKQLCIVIAHYFVAANIQVEQENGRFIVCTAVTFNQNVQCKQYCLGPATLWLPTKSKTVASNAIFGSLLVLSAVIYYVFKSSPLPQRCDLIILGACLNAND